MQRVLAGGSWAAGRTVGCMVYLKTTGWEGGRQTDRKSAQIAERRQTGTPTGGVQAVLEPHHVKQALGRRSATQGRRCRLAFGQLACMHVCACACVPELEKPGGSAQIPWNLHACA
eukprot:351469-Chlamydomonas_euryale.AAC.1